MSDMFKVVHPVAVPTSKEKTVASPLPDLNGKVIGELWNWAFRGDETFPMIEEELKAIYPDIKFVDYKTFGNFHDPTHEAEMMAALPDKLKEHGVDAVIVGNGCCGTCSPAVARGVVLVEDLGIPAVGILCKGFPTMARQVMKSAGYPDARAVEYPHPIALDSVDEVRKNIRELVIPKIIDALTKPVKSTVKSKKKQPGSRDIIFEGSYEEVQNYFYEKKWSDGLPLVPPTIEKVEEFLSFTDRDPEEVIGIVEPAMSSCTVWKTAVNGVMAGCRPEYFPMLLAIAEIMATPEFSVKDSGATPGWEAMIMLNGPIRDELAFNYKIGHQRPDCMPNITIGRFYRLMLRNVAGFHIGSTDMSTHGQMFRPVIPENDQVCEEIGFKTVAEMRGYNKGDNVVSIVSGRVCSDPMQTNGATAEQHLDYMTDWATRMIEPYETMRKYQENHVLFLSPVVAKLLAGAGYDKDSIAKYILTHARVTAEYFELNASRFNHWKPYSLKEEVANGELGPQWYESDDPKRLVPLFGPDANILIIVVGDPTRNRSQFFRSNYTMAKLTSKAINLPDNWDEMLKEAKKK
ncbi:MAG: UGSC family (seleno)protein [Lachnospiraceae bacterium]